MIVKSPFSKHHNNLLHLNTAGLLSERRKLSAPSKKWQLSWHHHSVSTKLSNLYAKLFPHFELHHCCAVALALPQHSWFLLWDIRQGTTQGCKGWCVRSFITPSGHDLLGAFCTIPLLCGLQPQEAALWLQTEHWDRPMPLILS